MRSESRREGSQSIRANWLLSPVAAVLFAMTLVGIGAAFAESATTHESTAASSPLWPIAIATGSIVVVACATVFFSFVRFVRLSRSGLEFEIGLKSIEVEWDDLVPPRAPYFITINFRYRSAGVIQERAPLTVTRRVARAILQDPRCPRFELDAKVWASLGLTPPRSE